MNYIYKVLFALVELSKIHHKAETCTPLSFKWWMNMAFYFFCSQEKFACRSVVTKWAILRMNGDFLLLHVYMFRKGDLVYLYIRKRIINTSNFPKIKLFHPCIGLRLFVDTAFHRHCFRTT